MSFNKTLHAAMTLIVFTALQTVWSQPQQMSETEIDHFRKTKQYIPLSGFYDSEISGTAVIVGDLTIEKGKTVNIRAGALVFVSRGARIIVRGSLFCEGNWKDQVSLLSLPRGDYLNPPAKELPLAWEGIRVEKDGHLDMKFTRVSNSTIGISIDTSSQFVSIDTAWFRDNEISNLRVGETDIPIKGDMLERFQFPSLYLSIKMPPRSVLTRIFPPLQKKEHRNDVLSMVFSGVFLIGGTSLVFIEDGAARQASRDYILLTKFNDVNEANYQKAQDLKSQVQNHQKYTRIGWALTAIGLAGLTISIPF